MCTLNTNAGVFDLVPSFTDTKWIPSFASDWIYLSVKLGAKIWYKSPALEVNQKAECGLLFTYLNNGLEVFHSVVDCNLSIVYGVWFSLSK